MTTEIEAALKSLWESFDEPELVVCAAATDLGKEVLSHRDGEIDFDGWCCAYVKRNSTTFLVPLYENGD